MADEIANDKYEFEQKMNKLVQLFLRFNRNVEQKIAEVAEEHMKENFEQQGFVNNGLDAWSPRSPDLDPGRAILVSSGALKNSIQGYVPTPGKIIVASDIVYAKAHNEGVPERNLPQRKFIGNSKELADKIKKLVKVEFVRSVKNKLS